MALLFGVIAAVFLGASDFCVAMGSRRIPSITVTRTALIVAGCLGPVALWLVSSHWNGRDSLIGVLSGVAMSSGLMLLYRGYGSAPIGIVAPTASVTLTIVPIVYDLIRGTTPSALAAVGMFIAAAALVLTSYTPGGAGTVRQGLALGLGSGVLFGAAFTTMDLVSDGAGVAPVVVQRFAGFAALSLIWLFDRSAPLVAAAGPASSDVSTGRCLRDGRPVFVADRVQRGDAGPVSVVSSQFATVAVVLAWLINRERLRWWQTIGVLATGVGVALIAVA